MAAESCVGSGLVGRARERALIEAVLREAGSGNSRVLVVRGEPGIGKTALLEHAIGRASDFTVVRATGVESEMELPFAGLQQLCASMLDRVGRLAEPQRRALSTAFGLATGPPPDRFLVGLASLSLLTEATEDAPLLCVIDDAQWLDHASAHALAFVARRLLADRVCLLFGTRGLPDDLEGLPEVAVEGLGDAAAGELLASVLRVPLDARVRERIVAESHGNPLALLEWPRSITAKEFGGGFGLPTPLPVADQIHERFRRRLIELPPATQMFLTVAAAEPTGDAALVWRASGLLGIAGPDVSPAVEAGLVEVGTRVRFRHPSVRSAAYAAAAAGARRDAHRALAAATDRAADPDRRAWHLALATPGPDEEVASELERSARRARARGGLAASAALLERSTALTLDPALRVRRTIVAANAHLEAGASEAGAALLSAAEAGPLDEFERARIELLQGGAALMWGDSRDAASLLLRAATRLARIDARSARETYLAALTASVTASSTAPGERVEDVAKSARAALAPADHARPHDLLLDGLATVMTDGTAAAAPTLRNALNGFRDVKLSDGEGVWYAYQCAAATVLWDHESFQASATCHVQVARDVGALKMLPLALDNAALPRIFSGDLSTAESLIREAESVLDVTRSGFVLYAAAMLAGWRGHEQEAERVIGATISEAHSRGQGMAVKVMKSALATLYNGLGRYEQALTAAKAAAEPPSWWAFQLTLHELVEAAFRTGERAIAANALERLSETTRPIDTAWATGVEARSRALLSTGAAAEALYLDAIDRLDQSPVRPEAARAHLVFGEWLRRQNRRVDARQHLRVAYEGFSALGMDAFAERTTRELRATGEKVRKRTVDTRTKLTAQEAQVAMLARDGLSNREIASRLFISAHTVQYHLSKVFAKLGVTSRSQLDRALPSSSGAEVPNH